RTQVARLRCLDPNRPWKLVCQYKWEEDDRVVSPDKPGGGGRNVLAPPPAAAVGAGGSASAGQARASGSAAPTLRGLLAGIGMESYYPIFEREELTLELLRTMAKDEAEFRRNLVELGINKMGAREKILLAVKTSF